MKDKVRLLDPVSFYSSRLQQQKEALAAEQRRSGQLSLGRVSTFLLGASSIGAHIFGQAPGALPLGLGLLGVFTVLVLVHARVAQREEQRKAAVLFNERGLARARDEVDRLPPRGDPRKHREHPYASDLDLLGERSVMARLDAMETEPSETLLTAWLLAPAAPEEVRSRQEAVQELTPLTELREALFVHARPVATKNPDLARFASWSQQPGPRTAGLTVLGLLLPVATAILFFGGAALGAPPWAWGVTAGLQWALTMSLGALGASGCGGTLYAVQASSASSKVNEAKAIGAEKLAPYEFYLAEEHLQKASEEASHANYGDAVELAEKAEEAADKAIKLSRDAHKGKGR